MEAWARDNTVGFSFSPYFTLAVPQLGGFNPPRAMEHTKCKCFWQKENSEFSGMVATGFNPHSIEASQNESSPGLVSSELSFGKIGRDTKKSTRECCDEPLLLESHQQFPENTRARLRDARAVPGTDLAGTGVCLMRSQSTWCLSKCSHSKLVTHKEGLIWRLFSAMILFFFDTYNSWIYSLSC